MTTHTLSRSTLKYLILLLAIVPAKVRADECVGPEPCTASSCTACCNQWGDGERLIDNLSLFLGLEGSKQPQDFGVNAHFGGRFHANWGIPLARQAGLGLQIGAAINSTRNAVQVVERIEGSKERRQVFSTIGLFQRTNNGFLWGIGYDFLQQDYYDDFDLGQWRGQFGYLLNPRNEVGARIAISDRQDAGTFAGIPLVLDPITQGSLYLRHYWPTSAVTTLWVGIAEGHAEANVALGDLPPLGERFLFGSDIYFPLNNHLAIYGEANFIQPADTGTVDAYLGVAVFPGGSCRALKRRFSPVLPVANNTSMALDFAR